MGEWHQQPNGMALRKLCECAHQQGESGFERLAQISVAHLYLLCQSETYANNRRQLRKIHLTSSPIGQRRAPEPNGQPGYLRMDTVHQGDRDKRKEVYYTNAVGQETPYEVVMAVAQLREGQVHSALQHMMEPFPFRIQGVHTDNSTEYVNHPIGDWLQQSGIAFTRSRSRRSNDNGLVESKNAAVVRINQFTEEHLNPYLNFHRSCLFSRVTVEQHGKRSTSIHCRKWAHRMSDFALCWKRSAT